MKVLILYASLKGSTADTARHIQKFLRQDGIKADCVDAKLFSDNLNPYQAIIIGAPIYKGMWLPELNECVKRNSAFFADKPVWIFSPCVRVLEPDGLAYAQENYIPQRLIKRMNVQSVEFFAGKLMQNQISHDELVTLSQRYDGNQLAHLSGDHRDWSEMDAWLETILAKLLETSPASLHVHGN